MREAVGLEPTSDRVATCFQDRLLIRPDDFRARDKTCQAKLGEQDLNLHDLLQRQTAYR